MRKIVSAITRVFAVFLVKSDHNLCSYSNLDITQKSWNSGCINFFLAWTTVDKETESEKNQFTFCKGLRATADVTKNGELGNRCQGDSCLSRKRDRQRARKGRDMYAHNPGVVCVRWCGREASLHFRPSSKESASKAGSRWSAMASTPIPGCKSNKGGGRFSTELH